jgi:hypothetical protein
MGFFCALRDRDEEKIHQLERRDAGTYETLEDIFELV